MPSQFDFLMAKPDQLIVANWWNPPYLIPLVEVVPGPNTSNFSIEVTKEFLSKIHKKSVVLNKESVGFIGNRLQFALLREAISLVEKGIASPEDMDEVVKSGFGRRLAIAGPFQVFDLAGWDTISTIMKELFPVRGFQSSVDYRLHFGLNKNSSVEKVLIRWPDLKTTVLKNVKANQMLTVEYAKSKLNKLFGEQENPSCI